MNWKRGLTRAYVTLWVLFAAAGVFSVWSNWKDIAGERATVNAFLAAHPGVKLEWLRTLKTDSVPYDTNTMKITFAPGVEVRTTGIEITDVASAAQSENTTRPTAKRLEAVGYWFLLCGVAPAIILMATRWITAGFARN